MISSKVAVDCMMKPLVSIYLLNLEQLSWLKLVFVPPSGRKDDAGTHVAPLATASQPAIPSSPSAWPLCSDVLMSTQSPAQCHEGGAAHIPDAALVDDAAAD